MSAPHSRVSLRHSARYASVPIRPARIAAASIASWKRSESCARAVVRPSLAVMWRDQMTVSSGSGRLHEAGQRRNEVAVAGAPLHVLEAEPLGRRPRAGAQVGVVRLCEVQNPAVVPEVLLEEIGMSVEAEP